MLCHRLIAVVLIHEGNVVQTRRFKVTNIVGNVKTAVKFFAKWDVDEICLIDISPRPWDGMLEIVGRVTNDVFVPVTVGGHISTHGQVREFLMVGADKILIRRAGLDRPRFIADLSERHGRQMVVCGAHNPEEAYNFARWGAGEVLLNSPEKDGTKEGFDLPLVREVSRVLTIPVIAMGGAGKPEHFAEAVEAGASAVAAGNLFHYMEHATVKAKEAMAKAGIGVRDAVL